VKSGTQIGETVVTGEQMHAFIAELFPLCRSITGDGVRATLRRIQNEVPLAIKEIPSGTPVFDWTVPREWNIRDAYIKNSNGERIVDFHESNLHVVSYSVPTHTRVPLAELRRHLHTLPDQPDRIPYRTSYYDETWGFCMTQQQFERLAEGNYEVCIDSTLEDGSLTYGELVLPGETPEELLFSCHVCHPSLCNDNLSGIAVATFLAQRMQFVPRHYSCRFLFIPGTIGAITWLAQNEETVHRIRHGLVLAGVGDRSPLTYKKSRRGSTEIDRAATHVLLHLGSENKTTAFSPYGYDERQFCSPGFDLPVGRLSRASHGAFPEYHTSADNLEFISPESLAETYAACLEIIDVLERNHTYVNTVSKCEPQLGKRGLYRAIGGRADSGQQETAMLWVLNLSDGGHSLLDIADRADLPFSVVASVAEALQKHGLLVSSSHAAQET
jgi:aminopeptidase-like protein